MDEPTNHLDLETVEALAKALKKFKVCIKWSMRDNFVNVPLTACFIMYGRITCISGGTNNINNIINNCVIFFFFCLV